MEEENWKICRKTEQKLCNLTWHDKSTPIREFIVSESSFATHRDIEFVSIWKKRVFYYVQRLENWRERKKSSKIRYKFNIPPAQIWVDEEKDDSKRVSLSSAIYQHKICKVTSDLNFSIIKLYQTFCWQYETADDVVWIWSAPIEHWSQGDNKVFCFMMFTKKIDPWVWLSSLNQQSWFIIALSDESRHKCHNLTSVDELSRSFCNFAINVQV